jgi:hypothetical protein
MIAKRRLFFIALLSLVLLAGCAAQGYSSLTAEAVGGLRLIRTEVVFEPGAYLNVAPFEDSPGVWGRSREEAREATKGHVREALVSEFAKVVSPKLSGARPVYARITVGRFIVPGALQTALADGSTELSAGVDLIDAKTGETLASAPPGAVGAWSYKPRGAIGLVSLAISSRDPIDAESRELSQRFATNYWAWLQERTAAQNTRTQ